ncbi:MAG: hypothetical protein ACI8RD_008871 [Bacillariaceae sp.]
MRKDVAVGIYQAGNHIRSLGKTYYNSVSKSVRNELIASGVTVEMLVDVLQALISFEQVHPTKRYEWDEYVYTSKVSQHTSKRMMKAELKAGDVY